MFCTFGRVRVLDLPGLAAPRPLRLDSYEILPSMRWSLCVCALYRHRITNLTEASQALPRSTLSLDLILLALVYLPFLEAAESLTITCNWC